MHCTSTTAYKTRDVAFSFFKSVYLVFSAKNSSSSVEIHGAGLSRRDSVGARV